MSTFKIALCQTPVCTDKEKNLSTAVDFIERAVMEDVDIVVLPEMFNCPYDYSFFKPFSEDIYGETAQLLSKTAKKHSIYIVGGSIPEICGSEKKLYNSSLVFSPEGKIVARHRKMHLFDISIPGKMEFKESNVFSSGDSITTFETPYCKIGLAICYDIRFPQLFKKMALQGAQLILLPAAFNTVTGPAHWRTLLKCRAIDNQVYFAGISPARDSSASYEAYGHTTLVSPWGEVIEELSHEPGILIQNIDLENLKRIREELPVLKHTKEIY